MRFGLSETHFLLQWNDEGIQRKKIKRTIHIHYELTGTMRRIMAAVTIRRSQNAAIRTGYTFLV